MKMTSNSLFLDTAIPKQAQRNERSKGSKGVNCGVFYVVEKMERETRIELATNSLEGCDSTIELLPLLLSIIPLPVFDCSPGRIRGGTTKPRIAYTAYSGVYVF